MKISIIMILFNYELHQYMLAFFGKIYSRKIKTIFGSYHCFDNVQRVKNKA